MAVWIPLSQKNLLRWIIYKLAVTDLINQ